MNYDQKRGEITLEKELNKLDAFVLDFVANLDKYVIVSGYVSILLGRSRSSEDIDFLIPEMLKEEFVRLWKKLADKGFWCINTSKPEEAFSMLKEHAIRFCKKDPIPNIEFKIIKTELDKFSYEHRLKVMLNSHILYISPLELQIAFKLYLGSEKDVEDAWHIYSMFKEKINKEELRYSLEKLNVTDKFNLIK